MEKLIVFTGQRVLPDFWLNKAKRAREVKKLLSTVRKGSESYHYLRDTFKDATSRSWREMSDKLVDEWVDKMLQRVGDLPLTANLIEQARKEWEDKRAKGHEAVSQLSELKELTKETGISIKENPLHDLVTTNYESYVDEASKVSVPKEAREYWRLCQNVRQELNRLISYAKSVGARVEVKDVLNADDPETFAREWLRGRFSAKELTSEQLEVMQDVISELRNEDNDRPRILSSDGKPLI